MLDYDGLENIARLKRLSLRNTEKDYLLDLVLFSLYSRISDEFILKGGTALYKIYKLGRFSEDLDFTLTKKVDIDKIAGKVIADLELLNIKGKIKEIKKYKNEINVRLLFNGPLYKGSKETQCFIPLNISLKESVCLEPKKETVFSLYREIPDFAVFVMHEREILAEKVRAILTRDKPRDIYDLWFLLKKGIVFDISLVNKKLILYNLKFNLKDFNKAISKKRGLWNLNLKNLVIGELPAFDTVRKEILKKIK